MCPHWHLSLLNLVNSCSLAFTPIPCQVTLHSIGIPKNDTFGYASFEVITPQSLRSRTHGARIQTSNLRANRRHFAPVNYFLEYPFILITFINTGSDDAF